jgi:hypothetical protein
MPTDIAQPYLPETQAAQSSGIDRQPPVRPAVLETVWAFLLVCLTIFSAVITAIVRPLWYDEIGTATVSGLDTFSKIWAALLHAADAQPPPFFWVTSVSRQTFSIPEFGLRFPAIAGFALLTVCLYVFTRRAWGRRAALVAILVLMCSQGLYYASEARPYGILLGCLGVAALLWQNRRHGSRSAVNLIGFLAALTALCGFHYYGLFVVVVFEGVEITLAVASRRHDRAAKPDWAMLLGIPLCTAPIVWAKPLIDASRQQIAPGFWARPSLKAIADGYAFSLGNVPLDRWTLFRLHSGRAIGIGDVLPPLLLIAAIIFFFSFSVGRERRFPAFRVKAIFQAPAELLLATGLLLLPLIAGLAAIVALGGYTPRYTIGAIVGSAILAAWIASWLGRRLVLTVAAVLTLLFAGIQSRKDVANLRSYLHGETAASIARQRFGPLYRLIDNGTPVVVPDGHLLFESWYYSRPESRRELIYLQNRQMAIHFSGSDSFDVMNELLNPWMNLHLEDPPAFVHNHREFFMAERGNIQSWNWANKYLESSGARYQPVEKGDDDLVIDRVVLPGPMVGKRLPQNNR